MKAKMMIAPVLLATLLSLTLTLAACTWTPLSTEVAEPTATHSSEVMKGATNRIETVKSAGLAAACGTCAASQHFRQTPQTPF